jgi:hypothetical protein
VEEPLEQRLVTRHDLAEAGNPVLRREEQSEHAAGPVGRERDAVSACEVDEAVGEPRCLRLE